MRTLIQIIQVILSILLALFLFGWLGFHASGHKIPLKTDLSFIYTITFILVFLLGMFFVKRRL